MIARSYQMHVQNQLPIKIFVIFERRHTMKDKENNYMGQKMSTYSGLTKGNNVRIK